MPQDSGVSAQDLTLEISRFEGTGNYTPQDDGELAPLSGDKWKYTAFEERKTDKHPEPVYAYVIPKFHDVVIGPESPEEGIQIKPVFITIVGPRYPGPGQPVEFPDNDDKQMGIDFVIWKYGVGNGYSMTYSDDPADTNGQIAYTWLYAVLPNSTYLSDAALENENRAASVIGHEAVHRDQGYYGLVGTSEAYRETPAYKWEVDHKGEGSDDTGIEVGDPTYTELTEQNYENYKAQLEQEQQE